MQQMDLVRVQHHNVMSVNTTQACLTAEQLVKDYPDVFQGTGKLGGQYKLEVEEGSSPVVHPPRRVPVALKEPWYHRESHRAYPVGLKPCNCTEA